MTFSIVKISISNFPMEMHNLWDLISGLFLFYIYFTTLKKAKNIYWCYVPLQANIIIYSGNKAWNNICKVILLILYVCKLENHLFKWKNLKYPSVINHLRSGENESFIFDSINSFCQRKENVYFLNRHILKTLLGQKVS